MPKTFCHIHVQVIFAVKYRQALIRKEWSQQLFNVIASLFWEAGVSVLIVNGVSDHVHCLIRMSPTVALSDVMKIVKARSSKFVNDQKLTRIRFSWQVGYAAFSYHKDQVERVWRYVENQEAHHGSRSFPQEYRMLLDEYAVEEEQRTYFEDPS